jgi:hypothetical protein
MSTPTTLDRFYVGWSDDNRVYQLLGLYEAENMKNAVSDASKNHGKPGRYLVMPEDKITLFDVTFDMVPNLDKVSQTDTVPPPDTSVIIP